MSKETKWTPGPWEVDGDVICGDRNRFGETVTIAHTLDVAFPFGRRAIKEMPHNAQLIAAAPDLYNELSAILELPYIRDHLTNERLIGARRALAKARGECE